MDVIFLVISFEVKVRRFQCIGQVLKELPDSAKRRGTDMLSYELVLVDKNKADMQA